MMAGSHVVVGAAAWLASAHLFGEPAVSGSAVALAVAGSLLPDIDHPKSWVGRKTKPVSTLLGRMFGHRGVTHSLLAVGGCAWLLVHQGVPRVDVDPLVVGYLSHLAGDLITPRGLRLAWPFRGTWSLPVCRSGSASEALIVAAIVAWIWSGTGVGTLAKRQIRELGVCDAVPGLAMVCRQAPRAGAGTCAAVRHGSRALEADRRGRRPVL